MPHLLILHQGALGDFLLALSIIQSVRAALSPDRVTAIASAPSARLAAGRSAVDAYLSPEAVALHALFTDTASDHRLSAILAGATTILNFLSAPADPIHTRLSRLTSARIISIDPRPTEATIASRLHITNQWAAAIRAQNLPLPDPAPTRIHLRNPANPRNLRSELETTELRSSSAKSILIHPGSGGQHKCWPLERFIALAEALRPAKIHWLLGPAEHLSVPHQAEPVFAPPYQGGVGGGAASPRFAALQAHCLAHAQPVHIEHDLESAAQHMIAADLYIGNDSGATHLAAALAIPTLAIFGPTDPTIWRPLGENVHVVAPPTPSAITSVPLAAVLSAATILIR